MPAFRSVVSVLVRFVMRSFSPGSDTTAAREPTSPNAQAGPVDAG
jgi:hypothetical protein